MAVWHHFAQAGRVLRNAPGFTSIVVLILAFGIGANTAIFTLVDRTLLRPLPYRNPSALLFVDAAYRDTADDTGCLSYPHFNLVANRNRTFESIAAFTSETFNFSNGSEAFQLQAARVSANFFNVLGLQPAIGRSFTVDEGKPGARLVAILSDAFWRRRLNGDPNIAGRPITLDSNTYTVVGVLPPSFQFAPLGSETEIWTAHYDELNLMTPQQLAAGACYLDAVARLRPGSSITASQAEMKVLNQQYLREFPKLADADPKRPLEVTPLKAKLVSNFRSTFLILSASVGLVLLIACANVAGLLLARGLKRQREIAIRAALGAARSQIVSQLLAESLLLGLLSGTAGVGLSVAATRSLARFAANRLAIGNEIAMGLDSHILIFAVVISAATALLFGLAPALQFSKPDVSTTLREQGRGTAGARTSSLSRHALAAGQIALSLVLLIAASLLIRSFARLAMQPVGFEPAGVLTMNLTLPPSKYAKPTQMIDFYDRLLTRVTNLPGVEAAAVASALPVNIARMTPVLIEGQPSVPLAERPIVIIQTFTPSYLKVMRIPLLRGRFFNEFDRGASARVLAVNESFARRYFPGQDAVGKHILLGKMTAPAQIAGIIGDIKNVSLSAMPEPEIDIPFTQLPWARMNLLVRAKTGDPTSLVRAVLPQISKVDREQPATAVETLSELLAGARAQPRMIMSLLTAFAAFAFLLAIVGLYSVLNYSVAQRTQEMGVRAALGATRRNLLTLVLCEGALLAAAGIIVGLGCALAVTRILTKLIYGVSATDPVTFFLIPIIFLATALLACYAPAFRASRVEVTEALRQQ